jgi:hypothetical protein
MRLSEMNSLILGDTNLDIVIDASELPAPDVESFLERLPASVRGGESRMRHAVLAALAKVANLIAARVGRLLAAQNSPRFASASALDAWRTFYQRSRVAGEEDRDYRQRLLGPVEKVAPRPIKAVVRQLVADITTVEPAFLEPAVDAAYCSPIDDCPWASFLQPRGKRLWAIDPTSINPTAGAYIVRPEVPAQFWVVIPGDAGDDSEAPFCVAESGGAVSADFLNGPQTEWNFTPREPDSLMERIRSEIEERRAAGVTWWGLQDPDLRGAL